MSSYEETAPKKYLYRKVIGWFITAVILGGSFFLALAPTPYLVEQPGPTYNLLSDIGSKPVIEIPDKVTYPVSGDLSMLTVTLKGGPERGASWLELGLAKLDSATSIVNITDIYPEGWDRARLDEQSDLMMLDSQANAKGAALSLLNIPYRSEIKVTMVEKKGPAGNILKAADTVLTVQGEKATGLEQVRRLVAATKGQRTVDMEIVRDGKRLSVSVLPKMIDEQWRMGIFVQTVPTFPFEIDIQVGNVGGPSAGQMLALAIYDKLTPGELTGGKRVSGTGTINLDGKIGPIGGAKQKMYGARRAGHEWFLVPSENCDQVLGNIPEGLNVVKVSTIQDSLRAVKAIATNTGTGRLLTCNK
jgi:PDZ domain-containing protein